MDQQLLRYFEKRFNKTETNKTKTPRFITISRQTGCNGNSIATKLAEKLSDKTFKWNHINKEILDEAAKKLNLEDVKLKHLYSAEKLTHADEIISALSSRYYKSDRKLIKTITEVVQHFADDGNVVIVGRAAVGFTSNMPGGLHIRLIAPMDWRMKMLEKREGFSPIESKKFIEDNDKKKAGLIKRFCNLTYEQIPFDLTINCSSFSEDQITEIIMKSLQMKLEQ